MLKFTKASVMEIPNFLENPFPHEKAEDVRVLYTLEFFLKSFRATFFIHKVLRSLLMSFLFIKTVVVVDCMSS
jgi:hypothetical protein